MRPPSPLRDPRVAATVVGLVAALVFANAVANGFAYDDRYIIVSNRAIHSLATLPGALVGPYWPVDYGRELGLWRPTTTALLGLQHVAGGGAPWLFHAVNVALHGTTAALVVLLLAALMPLAAAFAAGLLFAIHPVHVEAVANVVGVAEILSTLALVGACLIAVRAPWRMGWGAALAVGALYALGFGAKESAVTLPGVMFLLDAARRRIDIADLGGYLMDRWRPYVVMLVVALAMLVGRYAVLGSVAHPLPPLGADILADIPRIWTLGEIWTHYVRLWAFPLDLASDYSPNVIPISIGWHATNTLGVAITLLVLVTTLAAWRRDDVGPDTDTPKAAALGVLWFMITIAPVSNTVFLSGVLLAERTLYLPSVGLAAATGWLVHRLVQERGRAAWMLLALAVAAAGVRTWTRTPTWRDTPAVLTTLAREHPQSGRSQWLLGDAFLDIGRTSEALLAYRAAIDLLGTHYQLLTEISKKLTQIGNYRAAEFLLRMAAENEPSFPLAPGLVALIRAEYGDAEATERWARRSLAVHEADPARHHLLAWALAAQGRWDEAQTARERALAQGVVGLWQEAAYRAYARREEGDRAGALAALDSAWARVSTDVGRAALDSVRVSEFGLATLLEPPARGTPPP